LADLPSGKSGLLSSPEGPQPGYTTFIPFPPSLLAPLAPLELFPTVTKLLRTLLPTFGFTVLGPPQGAWDLPTHLGVLILGPHTDWEQGGSTHSKFVRKEPPWRSGFCGTDRLAGLRGTFGGPPLVRWGRSTPHWIDTRVGFPGST
jgi:hypothetical protein